MGGNIGFGIQELFLTIVNLSLVGSYAFLLVALVRLMLRRAPGWCSYLLWGVVFLRLVCPVFPESGFSLIPSQLETDVMLESLEAAELAGNQATTGPEGSESLTAGENGDAVGLGQMAGENGDAVSLGQMAADHGTAEGLESQTVAQDGTAEGLGSQIAAQDGTAEVLGNQIAAQNRVAEDLESQTAAQDGNTDSLGNQMASDDGNVTPPVKSAAAEQSAINQFIADLLGNSQLNRLIQALSLLWLLVVLLLAGYHISSYWSLKLKVRDAVPAEQGVYEVGGEHLSFVMGIFKPVIYLSAGLDESSRRVVLCHERVHLRRRDYLIKPTALAICCLHWFNPLVWVAFCLMNRDCEMSCDEKVVALLGEESKKIYSYALLDEATRGERLIRRKKTVCALLSFGEDNVKKRISHVLKYKKASVGTVCIAVIVLIVLTIGICSNPNERTEAVGVGESTGTNGGNNSASIDGTGIDDISGGKENASGVTDSAAGGEEADDKKDDLDEEQAILAKRQQTPEGALHYFAEAFYDGAVDILYGLSADQEKLSNWDLITKQENGVYTVGDSSLWVEDYKLDYEEGSEEAVIRFYMECATQEITIADEKVTVVKKDDLYYVDHEEFTLYDNITTRKELAQVYDLTSATPYDVSSTYYAGNYPRIILKHILYGKDPAHYEAYKDPVTAAQTMLHLGDGTGEITKILNVGRADEALENMPEKWQEYAKEGTVVNVQYTFAEDKTKVDIPMVLSEDSEGIWVVSCGDLTQLQMIGEPLLNDRVRTVYAEYTADGRLIDDADGNSSQTGSGASAGTNLTGNATTADDNRVAYQISSFGIYRVDGDKMTCIFPTLIPEDTLLTVYEGMLYFPTDSAYFAVELVPGQRGLGEGSLDWWYDSICVLNPDTGGYYFMTLLNEEQKLFPLDSLQIEDGVIYLEGGSHNRWRWEIALADRGLVWNNKKAVDLNDEEREAYGIYNRQYILEHPNQVFAMGHLTQGYTFALIDLDGDGKTEEISLEETGNNINSDPMEHHILKAGEGSEERYADNFYNNIFAFSPDGERIFIALYEDGPSGDPYTTIYKFQDQKLQEAGGFSNDIRDCKIENGIISTTIRNWVIQTDSIRVQYCMNEAGDLELLDQESYEYTLKDWEEWEITLKSDLPVHVEPESQEITILKGDQEIRFLALHNSWEWVLVETADGMQGWIHVVDGEVLNPETDDEAYPASYDCMEIFEGLSMAG